ncbi:MAG: fructose-bisphosphatase class III [Clostridia bacterium]|nr:fructose-bisphosphatase class III [Clostridia bacterium]
MAVYVCADLHGYPLEKFESLLRQAGFQEEDFLYVLGDVIDRGPDGVRILRWLMRAANAQLILGNHEAMMLGCDFLFEEITEDTIDRLTGTKLEMYLLWTQNEGQPTLDALAATRREEIRFILEYLREAPLFEALTVGGRDFILTHSGLGHFRKKKKLSAYTANELLWTRPKITQRYFDGMTVVFGHTPTFFYGRQYEGKAIVTPTWINIDVGAGYGIRPMLLRLDDLREFYLEE